MQIFIQILKKIMILVLILSYTNFTIFAVDCSSLNSSDKAKILLGIPKHRSQILLQKIFDLNTKKQTPETEDIGLTALHYAIKYNQKEIAKMILNAVTGEQKIALIMAVDHNNLTALHYATMYNQLEIVKIILDSVTGNQKLDLIMMHDHQAGNTALHYAVQQGYLDIAIELINCMDEHKNTIFMARNSFGSTVLHYTAMFDQLEIAKAILDIIPTDLKVALIRASDDFHFTALHDAANYGRTEIIKLLMNEVPENQKADFLMTPGNDNLTALHYAAINGQAAAAKALLDSVPDEYGVAFITAKDIYGNTALDYTANYGYDHQEVARILVAYYKYKHIEMEIPQNINLILQKIGALFGIDDSSSDSFELKNSLLEMPEYELTQIALQEISDLNISDSNVNQYDNLVESIKKLCKLKAVCTQFRIFFTPQKIALILLKKGLVANNPQILHKAIRDGHEWVVKVLLEAAQEQKYNLLMATDSSCLTTLSTDEKRVLGSKRVTLASKVMLNSDDSSLTALHYAAKYGQTEIAKMLLKSVTEEQKMALILATDRYKKTALHYAAQNFLVEVARALLESIPEKYVISLITAKDKDENTALYYATIYGFYSPSSIIIAKILVEYYRHKQIESEIPKSLKILLQQLGAWNS